MIDSLAGPVSGDAGRVQQVVWNLLSQCGEVHSEGGKVQVLLERVHSHLEISVTDAGIGMSPEFPAHDFDHFRQPTRARRGATAGWARGSP